MLDGSFGRTMTLNDGLRHFVTTGFRYNVTLCNGKSILNEDVDDEAGVLTPTCLACWARRQMYPTCVRSILVPMKRLER